MTNHDVTPRLDASINCQGRIFEPTRAKSRDHSPRPGRCSFAERNFVSESSRLLPALTPWVCSEKNMFSTSSASPLSGETEFRRFHPFSGHQNLTSSRLVHRDAKLSYAGEAKRPERGVTLLELCFEMFAPYLRSDLWIQWIVRHAA